MPESLGEELARRGYAKVSLPASYNELPAALEACGQRAQMDELPAVQLLTPRAVDAPNTYSGNFGTGAFPLHTDMAHWALPPRFFILACVEPAPKVATLVVPARDIFARIDRKELSRTLVRPRRPHGFSRPILHLLESPKLSQELLRYDSVFIEPATARSALTLEHMREVLATLRPERVELLKPGDAVVIDNWRVLHGREPVLPGAENRKIARMYFSAINL